MVAAHGHHQRRAGDGIGDDIGVQAEDLLHEGGVDHLAGGADGGDAPVLHGDHVVGVAGRQVDVVEHHDDRRAPAPVEVGEQVEDLHLVGQIEEGRRLVQQEDVGALGQGHGDPHALALTAGQLVDAAIGQGGGARGHQRLLDDLAVARRPRAEGPLMGMAPAPHQVGDRDALRGDGLLGEQAEPPGQPPGRDGAQGLAVEQNRSADRHQDPRHRLEQRRLPAGVGAHDDGDPGAGDQQVDAVDDDAPAVARAQRLGAQGAGDGGCG